LGSNSEVWKIFDEVLDLNTADPRVRCRICAKEYMHPYAKQDSNNSNLHKHLRWHKKKQAKESQSSISNRTINDFYPPFKPSDIGFTKSQLEQLLLDTAITCNWPFDQFNSLQFRLLIERGFTGHHCPTGRVMRKLLKDKASVIRADLKARLTENSSYISLALDCWTSPNRWEFMGMCSPAVYFFCCMKWLAGC
jgi:hypothetical protein